MSEPPEIRLKRVALRSSRRGVREMDLILATFADEALAGLAPHELDGYEALLEEPDQDLLAWITGQAAAPADHAALIARIAAAATAVARQFR